MSRSAAINESLSARQNLLLLLGGHYHDFEAFEAFVRELLPGYAIASTRDTGALAHLSGVDVVFVYTCHVEPPDEPGGGLKYTAGISDAETASLAEWVRSGGGLLALHSATTIRDDNHELKRLYGGRFVSHPPRFPITIYPLDHDHPVTRGVESFTVFDELYTQEYGQVDVHAVAVDRGTAYPMVWTRGEGRGRVVHVSPGHDERTWSNGSYRRLLTQAVKWAAGG